MDNSFVDQVSTFRHVTSDLPTKPAEVTVVTIDHHILAMKMMRTSVFTQYVDI